MSALDDRDLSALRELSEAASPGPWKTWTMPDPGPNRWQMVGLACNDGDMSNRGEVMFREDAAFIVAAVNYVRALFADTPPRPNRSLTEYHEVYDFEGRPVIRHGYCATNTANPQTPNGERTTP